MLLKSKTQMPLFIMHTVICESMVEHVRRVVMGYADNPT